MSTTRVTQLRKKAATLRKRVVSSAKKRETLSARYEGLHTKGHEYKAAIELLKTKETEWENEASSLEALASTLERRGPATSVRKGRPRKIPLSHLAA